MQENRVDIKKRMADLKGIIWDLDNTLYRFEGDFERLCHVAAAKAAIDIGIGKAYDDVFEICLKSYDIYGHSYRLLLEEYDLDREEMHYAFHAFIDEKLITKSADLVDFFGRIELDHVIVTHASKEWAERALSHIGLKNFFPSEKIIAAEEVDFHRKSESELPIERALEIISHLPENLVMVEDIKANLEIPYKKNIGTVLIHHDLLPDDVPEHIDLACKSAAEFFELVLGHK